MPKPARAVPSRDSQPVDPLARRTTDGQVDQVVLFFDGLALCSWVNHPGRGGFNAALSGARSKVIRMAGVDDSDTRVVAAHQEVERLTQYLDSLQGAIPIAPDHELMSGFTADVIFHASGHAPPDDARDGAVDRAFFERLVRKFVEAQSRPDTQGCGIARLVEYVAGVVAHTREIDKAVDLRVAAVGDPRLYPRRPSYRPVADFLFDACLACAPALVRPGVGEERLTGLDRYAEEAIRAATARASRGGRLRTPARRRPRLPRTEPTAKQIEAKVAYDNAGSFEAAGDHLGISGEATRKRVRGYEAAIRERERRSRSVSATRGLTTDRRGQCDLESTEESDGDRVDE